MKTVGASPTSIKQRHKEIRKRETFNEELYFQDLSFSFLLGKSRKQAVIVSSLIFGVLHAD
jgi:hypothetical protein